MSFYDYTFGLCIPPLVMFKEKVHSSVDNKVGLGLLPGLSLFLSDCLPSLSFYGQTMAGQFKNQAALHVFNLKALQTISVGCVFFTEPRTKSKKCQ
jgi:hypothetical protein